MKKTSNAEMKKTSNPIAMMIATIIVAGGSVGLFAMTNTKASNQPVANAIVAQVAVKNVAKAAGANECGAAAAKPASAYRCAKIVVTARKISPAVLADSGKLQQNSSYVVASSASEGR